MSVKAGQSIEQLYLGEKKKSQIFLASTVLLAIGLIGAITAYVKKPTSADNPTVRTPQFAGGMPDSAGNGGQFRMGGFQDLTQFFKADGSIDSAQLDELTSRLPAGASDRFLSRFEQNIDQAVADGTLTQEQATKLKAALKERTANAQ